MKDPRVPFIAAADPLLSSHSRGSSSWDAVDTEPVDLVPASFLAELEALVEERVQLTADLCQLLWKQHEVEAAIRRHLRHCTARARGDELLRQCFTRARQRLAPEFEALEVGEDDLEPLLGEGQLLSRVSASRE